MTIFADRQFLWDWHGLRTQGRQRYATQRAGIASLLPIWGGINLAVRPPPTPDLLLWTIGWAAAFALVVFFASRHAFDRNERRFAALLEKGEPVPSASPQKQSGLPRYAILIGLGIAAIIPIAFPLIAALFR